MPKATFQKFISLSFIMLEAPLIRKPNLIKFKAEAEQKYIIKYNYHKGWKAFQNKADCHICL